MKQQKFVEHPSMKINEHHRNHQEIAMKSMKIVIQRKYMGIYENYVKHSKFIENIANP